MITLLSPAKVNLYLKVLGKRKDGYHDIETLMQRINLCDEMTFSRSSGGGISVHCPEGGVPEDENNIAYKAACALLKHASRNDGIDITIKKRIPVAAGLGGGSSNAASTLIAINDMLDLRYSIDDLLIMGASLGADVPFFIFGKTAWAYGIGDKLMAAENIPKLWFVLINCGIVISTKMIYENINFKLTRRKLSYNRSLFNNINNLTKGLYNDLERVTLKLYPDLVTLKNLLLESGAHGALMSGSGSTVFGIFADESEASKAEEALKAIAEGKWFIYKTHSI